MNSHARQFRRRRQMGRSRRRVHRRGIESIELLLGLPVLLLVVGAGFEYGWMLLRTVQLDYAARVGARAATLADADSGTVTAAVNGTLQAAGIEDANIEFPDGVPQSIPSGGIVSVRLVLDYADLSLLRLGELMPLPESLEARAAMVREP